MCVCVCLAQGIEEDCRSGDKRTNYSEIYEGKFIIRPISFIFSNLTLKSIKWKQTNISKKEKEELFQHLSLFFIVIIKYLRWGCL